MDFQRQATGRNIGDEIRRIFFSGDIVSRLILINTTVFLLIQVYHVGLWLFNQEAPSYSAGVSWWLGVHAWLPELMIKPWGIITYMFTHEGFWHIFWNMFMLYFGARLFLPFFGPKRLLNVYLMGGVMGALFFILSMYAFPRFDGSRELSSMIGASASVLAIIVAAAAYRPQMEINLFLIGRVKLMYLAIAFVAIDILSISQSNAGGHFAHLGGAFMGYLYVMSLKRFKIPSFDIGSLFKRKRRPGPRLYDPVKERPLTDEEYNARKKERQGRIDEILDKLKEKGYQGLTKEEKEFLQKAGK